MMQSNRCDRILKPQLLGLLRSHKFAASDFIIENDTGAVKFFSPVINTFIVETALEQKAIDATCDFLISAL